MIDNKKDARYQRLFEQLEELLKKTDDPVAKMATVAAVLYHKMEHFFWCGFYRHVNGELIVGPYQGPLACQILHPSKGVCRAAVETKKTVVVPDVHQFPGHIACDSRSQSEIVIPLLDEEQKVWAVLDVDSKDLNAFDNTDAKHLEKIVRLIHP